MAVRPAGKGRTGRAREASHPRERAQGGVVLKDPALLELLAPREAAHRVVGVLREEDEAETSHRGKKVKSDQRKMDAAGRLRTFQRKLQLVSS